MDKGGEDFDLTDDNAILSLTAPQDSVGGPYVVVYKDIEDRWAIVAMTWKDKPHLEAEPRLGIRWFYGKNGMPVSNFQPVWFVVPPPLSKSILSGLPLDHRFSSNVDKFLAGDLSGDELAESVGGDHGQGRGRLRFDRRQCDTKLSLITAPQDSVGGPYVVVYKNIEDRWAIVAMTWKDGPHLEAEPRLGIRWFWGEKGMPVSNFQPVWFVVPPPLSKSILSGLPLDHRFSNNVDKFLAGDLSGDELAKSLQKEEIMDKGGEDFDLTDDNAILRLTAPQDSVGGPYVVVYKDIEDRWAIVAMTWENKPRLGIRWFWGENGTPTSRGYPVWFVVPPPLSKSILSGLPLDHKFSSDVDKFLAGHLSGDKLAK